MVKKKKIGGVLHFVCLICLSKTKSIRAFAQQTIKMYLIEKSDNQFCIIFLIFLTF